MRRFFLAIVGVSLAVSAAMSGERAGGGRAAEIDPSITRIMEAISEERLAAILSRLQDFETRNTFSSPDPGGRGIGAARQWILEEMGRSSPRLQVAFDSYQVPPQGGRITREVEIRNVVALLPGKSERRFYVVAHYDSLVVRPRTAGASGQGGSAAPQSFDTPAPGVNDDGSGTALVMELARVFAASGLEFDATLVFLAVAGEEQGLLGARLHAQRAEAEGWVIDAVLNNDMIGNVEGGDGVVDASSVRVFSEGPEDSLSRQLARYTARYGAKYLPSHKVRLVARHDRFGRGGDHTAFNQHGFAGVRFTETKENYSRQHTQDDTLEGVDVPYLTKNVRLNAAVLANLALAPPAPVVFEKGSPMLSRQPSGYDATLRWRPSPGAAAYRVFWRDAWTPDWQHELLVGDVTEAVLPGISIDDYVLGVAAVGPQGHESLVSVYVNPPRASVPIKSSRDRTWPE
jgi:hypothetical protein